jgi:hypothetical protein
MGLVRPRTRRERTLPDRWIVTAVASYRSKALAHEDVLAVRGDGRHSMLGPVATAVVEKGDCGRLLIESHECTATEPPWNGAVLGSVLTVLAPPAGLQFLVPLVGSGADLGGVSALVSHFWNNMAQDDLARMGELLESGQTGLVVVAGDADDTDLERLLALSWNLVVATTSADLESEFARGLAQGGRGAR